MPQPKMPTEKDWQLLKNRMLRLQNPKLRSDLIDEMAELAEEYLEPAAVEFSNEDLHSNLYALWKISKSKKAEGKMSERHAKKVLKLVCAAFSHFNKPNAFHSPEGTGSTSSARAQKNDAALQQERHIAHFARTVSDSMREGLMKLKKSARERKEKSAQKKEDEMRLDVWLKTDGRGQDYLKKILQVKNGELVLSDKSERSELIKNYNSSAVKKLTGAQVASVHAKIRLFGKLNKKCPYEASALIEGIGKDPKKLIDFAAELEPTTLKQIIKIAKKHKKTCLAISMMRAMGETGKLRYLADTVLNPAYKEAYEHLKKLFCSGDMSSDFFRAVAACNAAEQLLGKKHGEYFSKFNDIFDIPASPVDAMKRIFETSIGKERLGTLFQVAAETRGDADFIASLIPDIMPELAAVNTDGKYLKQALAWAIKNKERAPVNYDNRRFLSQMDNSTSKAFWAAVEKVGSFSALSNPEFRESSSQLEMQNRLLFEAIAATGDIVNLAKPDFFEFCKSRPKSTEEYVNAIKNTKESAYLTSSAFYESVSFLDDRTTFFHALSESGAVAGMCSPEFLDFLKKENEQVRNEVLRAIAISKSADKITSAVLSREYADFLHENDWILERDNIYNGELCNFLICHSKTSDDYALMGGGLQTLANQDQRQRFLSLAYDLRNSLFTPTEALGHFKRIEEFFIINNMGQYNSKKVAIQAFSKFASALKNDSGRHAQADEFISLIGKIATPTEKGRDTQYEIDMLSNFVKNDFKPGPDGGIFQFGKAMARLYSISAETKEYSEMRAIIGRVSSVQYSSTQAKNAFLERFNAVFDEMGRLNPAQHERELSLHIILSSLSNFDKLDSSLDKIGAMELAQTIGNFSRHMIESAGIEHSLNAASFYSLLSDKKMLEKPESGNPGMFSLEHAQTLSAMSEQCMDFAKLIIAADKFKKEWMLDGTLNKLDELVKEVPKRNDTDMTLKNIVTNREFDPNTLSRDVVLAAMNGNEIINNSHSNEVANYFRENLKIVSLNVSSLDALLGKTREVVIFSNALGEMNGDYLCVKLAEMHMKGTHGMQQRLIYLANSISHLPFSQNEKYYVQQGLASFVARKPNIGSMESAVQALSQPSISRIAKSNNGADAVFFCFQARQALTPESAQMLGHELDKEAQTRGLRIVTKEVAAIVLGKMARELPNGDPQIPRILKALSDNDKSTGDRAIMDLLARKDFAEAKKFNYFCRLLMKSDYLSEKAEKYLATAPERDMLRQIIAQYKSEFNTTINTLSEINGYSLSKNRDEIFAALSDLGAITPKVFEKYRALSGNERAAYVQKINGLKAQFFKNLPIANALPESDHDILTEMVYLAYRPPNMSYDMVTSLLRNVGDRTADLSDFAFPQDGYRIGLGAKAYKLGKGKTLELEPAQLRNLISMSMPISNEGTEEITKALVKVAKIGSQYTDSEVALLFGLLSDDHVRGFLSANSNITDINDRYSFISGMKDLLGLYFKDNYHNSLANFFMSYPDAAQSMRKQFAKPERRKAAELQLDKTGKINWDSILKDNREMAALLSEIIYKKALIPRINEINREIRKFEPDLEKTGQNKEYTLFISKNAASFFAKASAGICTSQDTELFKRSDHFHMNIIEDNRLVRANIQAFIINLDEGRALLLRGFNPNVDFEKEIDPKSFCDGVLEIARKFASENALNGVYVTSNEGGWHALSNRSSISSYLVSKYNKESEARKIQPYMISSSKTVDTIYQVYSLAKEDEKGQV